MALTKAEKNDAIRAFVRNAFSGQPVSLNTDEVGATIDAIDLALDAVPVDSGKTIRVNLENSIAGKVSSVTSVAQKRVLVSSTIAAPTGIL